MTPTAPSASARPVLFAAIPCAAFAFSLMAAMLVANLVPERTEEFETRIAWLQAHPRQYDIIFIGSSRVLHGFPVKVFDKRLRESDIELRPSFNMGILEAFMHHNFYTIRTLLDAGVRPKYLFVEASEFTSKLRGAQLRRFEVWHDLEETRRVLATTRAETDVPEFYGTRLSRAWIHIHYCLRRYLPIGRMLETSIAQPVDIHDATRLEQSRGYTPLEFDRNLWDDKGRRYFDDPALWTRRIEKLEADYDGEYARPANVRAFLDLLDYVRSHDVRLVFVGTPYSEIEWVEPLLWLEAEGIVSADAGDADKPLFLNFNLPGLPYIDDLELRFDEAHTNNAGSDLWARDLADAFASALEQRDDARDTLPGPISSVEE